MLSQSGKDFLIAALDPFHDNQLKDLQGWPDVETSASVVRCIKQTVSIANPLVGTAPWDLHVHLWPFLNKFRFYNNTRTCPTLLTESNSSSMPDLGGLQMWGTTAGTGLGDLSTIPGVRNIIDHIELDPVYSTGATRIVGLGFEIVNTTAVIARQGQITTYRLPGSHTAVSHYQQNGDLINASSVWQFDGQMIRRPPNDTQEAMLIAGSRQWAAEEGCYTVATFVGQDNPPILANFEQPMINVSPTADEDIVQRTEGITVLPSGANISDVYIPQSCNHHSTQINLRGSHGFKIYPINGCGAILTGLSSTSTFSITMNVYVESFPTPLEKDILVLATPSAEYDPIALEIFSASLSKMPVSVPVRENGLGDWFESVVRSVVSFMPAAAAGLTAAGFPELAPVAYGAGKLGEYLLAPSGKQQRRAKKNGAGAIVATQMTQPMNRRLKVMPPKPPPKPARRVSKRDMQDAQFM